MGKIILTPIRKNEPQQETDRGAIRIAPIPATPASPSPVVDEAPPRPLEDFLLETAEKEGCSLFGIIDSARNEDVFRYLITGNVLYKSLFEGTMDVQSYGVSGFLVECKKESPLFQWMLKEAWGDSACIFFISKASFDELFSHFQKFNRVYLEDDRVVLFRYYDPRVLRIYLPTCYRAELELFFGEVVSFFAEGEESSQVILFRRETEPKANPLQHSAFMIFNK